MKTFFIPIDFSESSLNICKYAIKIAGTEATKMHICHIYPDQIMVPDSSFPAGIDNDAFLNTNVIDTLKKQSEEKMDKLVQLLKKHISSDLIQLETLIEGGDPEWKIMEFSESLAPDIIVMGTKGKGNRGFLEGGTAKKIMNHSQIPVVVIPETAGDLSLKNIMYACDNCSNDFAKIKLLFRIFQDTDIKIFVTHLCLDKTGKEGAFMSNLKKSFATEQNQGRIFFHVIDTEDKNSALQAFTELNEIDLIAFIAHKKNFLKKFLQNKIHKEDFFKLDIPMLAVHSR